MQPNLQPCKSCGNADQDQVRFQVYIDQGLQMNIGPFATAWRAARTSRPNQSHMMTCWKRGTGVLKPRPGTTCTQRLAGPGQPSGQDVS